MKLTKTKLKEIIREELDKYFIQDVPQRFYELFEQYANQKVIEELERMEKECDINYLDGIEGWKITRRIKELKQK